MRGQFAVASRSPPRLVSVSVAATEHCRKRLNLVLAAAFFTGLLIVALGAHTLDDVLAIELLFHATDRTVNGLILADFDFNGHVVGKDGR